MVFPNDINGSNSFILGFFQSCSKFGFYFWINAFVVDYKCFCYAKV